MRRLIRCVLLCLVFVVPMPDTDKPTELPPGAAWRAPCASGELTPDDGGTLDAGSLSCTGKPRNC